MIKQRRKRKTKEELKQEDEERVKHWAKANSKLNAQERGEIYIVVLRYVLSNNVHLMLTMFKVEEEAGFDFMTSRLDVPQIDIPSQPVQALIELEKKRKWERERKAKQRAKMTTQERLDMNAKQNKRAQERKQQPTNSLNCPSIPWRKRIKKDGTPYKVDPCERTKACYRMRAHRAKKKALEQKNKGGRKI